MIRSLSLAALLAATVARTPLDDKPGFPPDVPFAAATRPTQAGIPPYRRGAFGTGWVIIRGQCDTREVALERDAGPAAVDSDDDGCRDDGPVRDLYAGRHVAPSQVDADHVVALADAWYSGAWQWTSVRRRSFAQDRANLRAVGASINRSKADHGPDEWRPPDRAGWCVYAATYRDTKRRWHLMVTPDQSAALADMLTTCPGGTR